MNETENANVKTHISNKYSHRTLIHIHLLYKKQQRNCSTTKAFDLYKIQLHIERIKV